MVLPHITMSSVLLAILLLYVDSIAQRTLCRCTEQTSYFWDTASSSWLGIEKHINQYSSQGQWLMTTVFEFDAETGAWCSHALRASRNIFLDSSYRHSYIANYTVDPRTNSLQETKNDLQRTENFYRSNLIDLDSSFLRVLDTLKRISPSKTSYAYVGNNCSAITIFRRDSITSEFTIPTSRTEFKYDSLGRLLARLPLKWNSNIRDWEIVNGAEKIVCSYPDNHSRIMTPWKWDAAQQTWQDSSPGSYKAEHLLDANFNPIISTTFLYNSSSKSWEKRYRNKKVFSRFSALSTKRCLPGILPEYRRIRNYRQQVFLADGRMVTYSPGIPVAGLHIVRLPFNGGNVRYSKNVVPR